MPKQPNMLLIMPDQMRGDCMSITGHPILETPAIDAIGHGGTAFTAGYTTCASCVPARRSLLTGRYPASNGMVGMVDGYRIPWPTLPQCLGEKAYFDAYYERQDLPDPVYGDWLGEPAGDADEVKMDSHRVRLSGDTLRRAQAGYFGLIKHIDDQIAPLIAEFKSRSEREGRSKRTA